MYYYEIGGVYINRNVPKSTSKVFFLSFHNWIFFSRLVTGASVWLHKKKTQKGFPGRSSTNHLNLNRFVVFFFFCISDTKTAKPAIPNNNNNKQLQPSRYCV
jgi:hypothetical protein